MLRLIQGDNTAPPVTPGSIAVVDMDRIYAASDAPEQLGQKAMQYQQEAVTNVDKIRGVPFLTQDELVEYARLLIKDKPVDADQTRMKALKALSDQRAEELRGLQTKKDTELTAADKTRLHDLTEQSRLLDLAMPGLENTLRTDQNLRIEEFRHEQIVQLRAMVAQVAKSRNISNVFDANSLVYSNNDLTPLVIQRLNKRSGGK